MIGYMMHAVEAVEDSSTVSKTIHLNAGVRRVLGVLAVIPDAYADPGVAMTTRIGLKYDGVEILPRGFSIALLLHNGLFPMREALLQTPYEPEAGGDISIDVEIMGDGRVPGVDLYFATEI